MEYDESSDDWCRVSIKSGNSISNNDSSPDDSLFEYANGYQTDKIHLYLSDMLISSVEQMQWNEFKKHIDFNQPLNPEQLFNFHKNIQSNFKTENDLLETQPCTSNTIKPSPSMEISSATKTLQKKRIFSESFDKTSHKLHYFRKREGNSIFYTDSSEDSGKIQSDKVENIFMKCVPEPLNLEKFVFFLLNINLVNWIKSQMILNWLQKNL